MGPTSQTDVNNKSNNKWTNISQIFTQRNYEMPRKQLSYMLAMPGCLCVRMFKWVHLYVYVFVQKRYTEVRKNERIFNIGLSSILCSIFKVHVISGLRKAITDQSVIALNKRWHMASSQECMGLLILPRYSYYYNTLYKAL